VLDAASSKRCQPSHACCTRLLSFIRQIVDTIPARRTPQVAMQLSKIGGTDNGGFDHSFSRKDNTAIVECRVFVSGPDLGIGSLVNYDLT
jgi:hypothetical protein